MIYLADSRVQNINTNIQNSVESKKMQLCSPNFLSENSAHRYVFQNAGDVVNEVVMLIPFTQSTLLLIKLGN